MKEKDWAAIFAADWPRICEIGKCLHDPEEKKAFWDTVLEKKRSNPRWSIYDDYPTSESTKERAMRECVNHIRSLRRQKEGESA